MHRNFCLMVAVLAATGAAQADEKADARALVEKAVQTMGGKEKLAVDSATTFKMKGKFYSMGNAIDYTGEIALQPPDKSRLKMDFEINAMKITFLQVFDGKK